MKVLNTVEREVLQEVIETWLMHETYWRTKARSSHVPKGAELLYWAPWDLR